MHLKRLESENIDVAVASGIQQPHEEKLILISGDPERIYFTEDQWRE